MNEFFLQNIYMISVLTIIVCILIWCWTTSISIKSELLTKKEGRIIVLVIASQLFAPVKENGVLFYITTIASYSVMLFFVFIVLKRMKRKGGQR